MLMLQQEGAAVGVVATVNCWDKPTLRRRSVLNDRHNWHWSAKRLLHVKVGGGGGGDDSSWWCWVWLQTLVNIRRLQWRRLHQMRVISARYFYRKHYNNSTQLQSAGCTTFSDIGNTIGRYTLPVRTGRKNGPYTYGSVYRPYLC